MPKGRVLAVDDQRYFRELLEGFLTEEGFEVQTASSAEEALHMLDHGRFDIVVTDLVMPGMDGNELVHRVKQRHPDQDIIVVTGVVDVKTAVEAMKLGASEYLLKPFDRATLASALEAVLQRRRLENEHARLLAENIEFMGERTLIERATQLFSVLAPGALAERIADGLCVETSAQGAVVWNAVTGEPDRLHLAAARGLVRVDEEPEWMALTSLPEGLCHGDGRALLVSEDGAGEGAALWVVLRRDGRVLGAVRLSDKLGGEPFDVVDAACADKFGGFAERALANAVHVAALERGSLEDPTTGAYVFEYLQGVARNEIEKAVRHGRGFAVVKLDLGSLDAVRRQRDDAAFRSWNGELVALLKSCLRSSDVLAADGEGRFLVLLPEADALGAMRFQRRARETLEESALFSSLEARQRPEPRLAVASYPCDGTQLEMLLRVLDERVEEQRRSPVGALGLERRSFAESLAALLERGEGERPEVIADLARFAVAEVGRRARDRGLLFVAPGAELEEAVGDGLAALRGRETGTDIVVVAEEEPGAVEEARVTRVRPPEGEALAPFLIRCGDGPAYALIRAAGDAEGDPRFFHTSDRSVVEHLVERLQSELAVPQLL